MALFLLLQYKNPLSSEVRKINFSPNLSMALQYL